MESKSTTILGIDPGTATTGFGVIKRIGPKFEFVSCGCILTQSKVPLEDRLAIINTELELLIEKYQPQEVAVEELFFANNAKTAIAVGQARGVILLTAKKAGLKTHEYTPLEVKMALTGYGRADKKQIQQMVKTILGLTKTPQPDDAADALAIAICHAQHTKNTKEHLSTGP